MHISFKNYKIYQNRHLYTYNTWKRPLTTDKSKLKHTKNKACEITHSYYGKAPSTLGQGTWRLCNKRIVSGTSQCFRYESVFGGSDARPYSAAVRATTVKRISSGSSSMYFFNTFAPSCTQHESKWGTFAQLQGNIRFN